MQIPPELRGPFLEALQYSQIRSMQNSQVYSTPLHQPGVCVCAGACVCVQACVFVCAGVCVCAHGRVWWWG